MMIVKDFSYTQSMTAKMGRPRIPKGLQKIPFPIRFTRDQIAAFKRRARRSRIGVKDWVTSILTEASK